MNNCNPHPSDVRDLEPVIFEAGLNYVIDIYEQEVASETKLYLIKDIGTLLEIQTKSNYGFNKNYTITGNDN